VRRRYAEARQRADGHFRSEAEPALALTGGRRCLRISVSLTGMIRRVTFVGDLVAFVLAALVTIGQSVTSGDLRLVVALAVGFVGTLVARHAARSGRVDRMV
jgi:hypothetical protein